MPTLNDLINAAKDDETKVLMRQVADLASAEARKALEGAHTEAMKDRERRYSEVVAANNRLHQEAMDRAHETIRKLNNENAALEGTVADRDWTISTMEKARAQKLQQHAAQLGAKDLRIAQLAEDLSTAQGWAVAGGFATLALGVRAVTGRRRT